MIHVQSPKDYLAIVKRRRRLLLVTLSMGLIASVVAALVVPSVYRSLATILIEEPDVPQDLILSTASGAFANRRVQLITRRVMTTLNLAAVIEKLDLYSELRRKDPIVKTVEKMRDAISLELLNSDATDRRAPQAPIAFNLAFDHRDPAIAQRVLIELVSLYLAENLRMRRQKAADTTVFLAQEARKYRDLIDEMDAEIARFKQQYLGRLPEQFRVKLQLRDETEREMLEIGRQIRAAKERRIFLQAELAAIDPVGPPSADADQWSPVVRLRVLRAQYVTITSRYGPDHPDTRKLVREIEALATETGTGVSRAALVAQRDAVQSELATLRQKYSEQHPDIVKLQRTLSGIENQLRDAPAEDTPTNPAYINLKAQVRMNGSAYSALKQQWADLEVIKSQYDRDLAAAPNIEREYNLLLRDYENIVASYNEIKTKQTRAELGEALETQRKGEQFSLLEAPSEPIEPVAPNRTAILVLGTIVSLIVGISLVLLAEILDDAVYGPGQLARIAGAPPLVVVPHIWNHRDLSRRRRIRIARLATVPVALGVLLLLTQTSLRLDVFWTFVVRHLDGLGLAIFNG